MPKITPISYKKIIRVFELEGFEFSRQKGDHLIYIKIGILRPLVIPMYDEVPVFVIKNLLRTAKMSRERYFDLLSRV
ncbi:MAG: type II toxin-antitoxin system HicA family toxin [Deltaproteobacteria bacterium]|nr:type II toxin-antitoxin system HicA family toxin [Deltaproteobacteria bacterium]